MIPLSELVDVLRLQGADVSLNDALRLAQADRVSPGVARMIAATYGITDVVLPLPAR